jgi:D-alanine-D-alanine ligase
MKSERPGRIVVLINSDYDAELTAGTGADVSAVRLSAMAVADALRARNFAVELVAIEGPDVLEVIGRLRAAAPDVIFNLCESMAGDPRNEPIIPGLLDLFGLVYTGGDAVALGLCLHKRRTKDVLLGRGVPTPPFRLLSGEPDLEALAGDPLDYPWFVKLAHEDASIGIEEGNVCADHAALVARTRRLWAEFDQPVLAEKYIDGREVNVTIVDAPGEAAPQVLPLHEIDFAKMPPGRPHIVSYAGKWDEQHVDYAGTKPVPLRDPDPGLRARIEAAARAAWDATGLRDYGRVDLRIDADGGPWVIDVNPNPDITPGAGVARAAEAAGIDYPSLVERIAMSAWRRGPRAARTA